MRLTTIMVPTDLSQYSLMVLPYAVALADRHQARLLLAHIALAPVEQSAAEARLAAIIRKTGLVDAEAIVATGDRNSGLMQMAQRQRASLVVIASHARSGVASVLMGSTAAALVHSAPCPVIVVKSPVVLLEALPIPAQPPCDPGPLLLRKSSPTAEDAYFARQEANHLEVARARKAAQHPTHSVLRLSLRSILLPMDFSEASRAALDVTRSLVESYHPNLVLIHVLTAEQFRTQTDESASTAYDRLDVLAADLPGASAEVAVGDPASIIAMVAARHHADLVVMGTHRRSRMSRLLMGSTSEAVMRQAQCPVMVVRADLEGTPAPAEWAELSGHSG